jgi:NADP-dependent 3-hydroxy acid dehydrogenase YdfG
MCVIRAYGIVALLTTDLGKAYVTDVTDYSNIKQVVDEIVKEFNGRLDIFVANVS